MAKIRIFVHFEWFLSQKEQFIDFYLRKNIYLCSVDNILSYIIDAAICTMKSIIQVTTDIRQTNVCFIIHR